MQVNEQDITNKELLRAINSGFTNVQEQINGLSGRMDSTEGALEAFRRNVDYRFDRIEERIPYLAPQFEVADLKKRMNVVEKKIGIDPASQI